MPARRQFEEHLTRAIMRHHEKHIGDEMQDVLLDWSIGARVSALARDRRLPLPTGRSA